MRKNLDGLDIWFLMQEFKELTNAKLQKIFQKDDDFVFQFFVSGKGKTLLKITPGFIFLIEKFKAPEAIKPFCKMLRKYLTNAILRDIQQIKTERIIQFNFSTKEKNFIIFAEFFDKGNLILCEEDKKIIHPFNAQRRKDRIIKRGEIYQTPKLKKSIFEANAEDFKNIKENISKTLAVEFGLGKVYAEEFCLRAKLDPKKKEFTIMEINSLLHEIEKIKTQKLNPVIIEGTARPFEFEKYKDKKAIHIESFNNALEKTFVVEQKPKPFEKKKERIEKIISIQEDQIKKHLKLIEECTNKGESIYHNYAMIKEILEGINKLKKEIPWAELKEKLKNNPHIKEILDKKQEIVVIL